MGRLIVGRKEGGRNAPSWFDFFPPRKLADGVTLPLRFRLAAGGTFYLAGLLAFHLGGPGLENLVETPPFSQGDLVRCYRRSWGIAVVREQSSRGGPGESDEQERRTVPQRHALAVDACGKSSAAGPLRSAALRFAKRTCASPPRRSVRCLVRPVARDGAKDAGGRHGPMPVTAPWPARGATPGRAPTDGHVTPRFRKSFSP